MADERDYDPTVFATTREKVRQAPWTAERALTHATLLEAYRVRLDGFLGYLAVDTLIDGLILLAKFLEDDALTKLRAEEARQGQTREGENNA